MRTSSFVEYYPSWYSIAKGYDEWSTLTAKIERCEKPTRIVTCICKELVKIQLEEVKSRHAVHAWWSYDFGLKLSHLMTIVTLALLKSDHGAQQPNDSL